MDPDLGIGPAEHGFLAQEVGIFHIRKGMFGLRIGRGLGLARLRSFGNWSCSDQSVRRLALVVDRCDGLLLGAGKPGGIAGVRAVEAFLQISAVGSGGHVLLLLFAQLRAVTLAYSFHAVLQIVVVISFDGLPVFLIT